MTTLIALYSPVMQSGKSEVAKVLQLVHNYQPVKFADPLKSTISSLLREGGATEGLTQRMLEGDLKEEAIPSLGTSARRLMQTLGDWGRSMHPDFWIKLATLKVTQFHEQGLPVVIDDLRFPNEYEAVLQMGGIPVRVDRAGSRPYTAHASEGLLEGYPMFTIQNNGTVQQLRACAAELPALLRSKQAF
jgi:hypothetical protein